MANGGTVTQADGRPELTFELRYRLLTEITEKVRGTLDLDGVLNHLIDAIKAVVDYDAAGIYVLKKDFHPFPHSPYTHIIAGTALRGFPRQPREDDPMLKWGKGIIGHVIRTGETVIVRDVRQDPRYVEGHPGTRSEIAVPIVVGQEVVGALNIESDRVDAFTEAHAEVLQFLCGAAAISIEKAIQHWQLIENKRLEYQMTIAREVQAGLLPEAPPQLPGYDIAAVNLPNLSISGDYFDYIPLPGGNVGIAIADVSGKGVPAALIMATFRAALRTQVRYESDITRIVRAVNLFLLESTHAATFVTAVFGVLEPQTGRFTYVNCGHTRPLLLHVDGRTELLDRGGLLLGVSADAAYEAATVRLDPADILALYTDGVVDLSGENGEELGAAGLERYIRVHWAQPASSLIECVVNATRALTHGQAYPDDFTLVIVRRQALI